MKINIISRYEQIVHNSNGCHLAYGGQTVSLTVSKKQLQRYKDWCGYLKDVTVASLHTDIIASKSVVFRIDVKRVLTRWTPCTQM